MRNFLKVFYVSFLHFWVFFNKIFFRLWFFFVCGLSSFVVYSSFVVFLQQHISSFVVFLRLWFFFICGLTSWFFSSFVVFLQQHISVRLCGFSSSSFVVFLQNDFSSFVGFFFIFAFFSSSVVFPRNFFFICGRNNIHKQIARKSLFYKYRSDVNRFKRVICSRRSAVVKRVAHISTIVLVNIWVAQVRVPLVPSVGIWICKNSTINA